MKKRFGIILISVTLVLSGCGGTGQSASSTAASVSGKTAAAEQPDASSADSAVENALASSAGIRQMTQLDDALDPQYIGDKYRTGYEVFVGSFYDSNGDGTGDLAGLTEQLDYINDGDPETTSDLEAEEIWTTPIFSSPTYHKYDVIDYKTIDPRFGTMKDFETYVSEAHKRGIKVVLDMPFNHTSTMCTWFTQAANYLKNLSSDAEPSADDCPYVDYYNFSRDAADGYELLEGTGWYYEARFWSGMPDLNLDNENVRENISDILSFWLGKDVDGFRLDAVTSYYTESEEKNIDFLRWINEQVKATNPDAYIVGECWTDQSVYADYYTSGVDSFFDFYFAGQEGEIAGIVRGAKKASEFAAKMASEEELYAEKAATAINAPFYTNHDMARSCGYYVKNNEDRVKLAGALNLLMTGHAYIYYGEELGMKGSGKDENKRAPMQWVTNTAEENAQGVCRGPEDMDDFDMLYPGLDEQRGDESSIFNYYRNALRIRNSFPVIARGRTTVIDSLSTDTICAFTRTMNGSTYAENAGAGAIANTDSIDPVLIIVNTGDETASVNLTDYASDYGTLTAVLNVGEDAVGLDDATISIPAFSVVILTA